MRDLTIGETARQAGVGVETIRFYERRGLIEQPLKPKERGFRVYTREQVKRIKFIRRAQKIGFSLHEIEELLSLRADPKADCSMVREQAVTKLGKVRQKIDQLRQIGAALEALIAVCPGRGGVEACSILDTLAETDEGADRPPRIDVSSSAGRPQRTRGQNGSLDRAKARRATNKRGRAK